jgi:hypothetical protein
MCEAAPSWGMDTNLYALEQLVTDRLAHARAEAGRCALVARHGGREARTRPSRVATVRRWLGLVLIDLGRALVEGPGETVSPQAGSRGG